MEYTPRTWKPQQGTGLNKYSKTGETGSVVYLTRSPDTITDQGTPLTDSAMNNLESGVKKVSIESDMMFSTMAFGCFPYTTLSQKVTGALPVFGLYDSGSDLYYAAYGGYIYKQTAYSGSFVAMGTTARNYGKLNGYNGVLYVAVDKILYSTTDGESLTQIFELSTNINGIAINEQGEIFASSVGGYIYKYANSTLSIFLNETNSWRDLAIYKGDLIACASGNYVIRFKNYAPLEKETISPGGRDWYCLAATETDLFAGVLSGQIWKFNGDADSNWFDSTALGVKDWTSLIVANGELLGGDLAGEIWASSVLQGNTWIVAVSFTMMALQTGSRKRIINTGSSTITVTFSGFTCDGFSTYTIQPDRFIDLEMITSSIAITTGGTAYNVATVTPSFSLASGWISVRYRRSTILVRYQAGFSSRTITAGDTIATIAGLPTGLSTILRATVGVDTSSVRTTTGIDFNIASDGTGTLVAYPNGDRALSGGTITTALGISGDCTFELL